VWLAVHIPNVFGNNEIPVLVVESCKSSRREGQTCLQQEKPADVWSSSVSGSKVCAASQPAVTRTFPWRLGSGSATTVTCEYPSPARRAWPESELPGNPQAAGHGPRPSRTMTLRIVLDMVNDIRPFGTRGRRDDRHLVLALTAVRVVTARACQPFISPRASGQHLARRSGLPRAANRVLSVFFRELCELLLEGPVDRRSKPSPPVALIASECVKAVGADIAHECPRKLPF
jgi:hypothetical protein